VGSAANAGITAVMAREARRRYVFMFIPQREILREKGPRTVKNLSREENLAPQFVQARSSQRIGPSKASSGD